MKIIFDEQDKILAKEYEEGKIRGLYHENGLYSLNFTISDIAKANAFLFQLFGQKNIVTELKNNAGLQITSMNLYPAVSVEFVKEQLKSIVNQIECEEQRFRN